MVLQELAQQIGYLLGIPSKLDQIIYTSVTWSSTRASLRCLRRQEGRVHLITEDEYLDIVDALPKENQYLDDKTPTSLWQMGADAAHDLLANLVG